MRALGKEDDRRDKEREEEQEQEGVKGKEEGNHK